MNNTETPLKQIPAISTRSSLERKYAETVLRSNPGLSDQAVAIASDLADSGLPPAMVALLIQAVYAPTDPQGRGQSTRLRWFIDVLQTRYGHRLEKIRRNPKEARTLISDVEDMHLLRDTLNGSGYGFTFHDAVTFWELGEDADSVMAMVEEFIPEDLRKQPVICVMRLRQAIKAVDKGRFTEISTALQYLNPEYLVNNEQYND